ncbi:MAG: DUF5106 domain-containing protein [Mangrovibacterium sp.]
MTLKTCKKAEKYTTLVVIRSATYVHAFLRSSLSVDRIMFDYMLELCKKYLCGPNSPLRNEKIYQIIAEFNPK